MTLRTPLAGAVAGAALVLMAAGCGSSGGSSLNANSSATSTSTSTSSSAGSSSSASASSSSGGTPCPTSTPTVSHPKQFTAPHGTVAKTAYTMRITFACKGTVTIAMNGKQTPATIQSFAFLAGQHWFDNTPCHRLTTSGIYVLQCGDPTGTGTGGPGYTIPDENLQGASYPAGTVAMANTGQPHTGGSQFFLVYANTQLPPQYTPFGHVTKGLDILRRIAAAGEDDANGPGDGHPKNPVVITSLTVSKG